MKNEFRKDRTDLYTKGLMAVTVLLGALTFLRIAGFMAASSEARAMAAKVSLNGQDATASGDTSKLLASAKSSAEELKKKNLFVLPTPRQHPVGEVLGILGDEALVNGEWHKVGDKIGEAKIVAIEPTKVRIAWDGKEKDFSPISAAGAGGGPAGRSGPSRPGPRPGPPGKAQVVVTNSSAAGPGAGRPRLTDDERARMRDQLQSMSPEQRQRAREEMRQKLGSRTR